MITAPFRIPARTARIARYRNQHLVRFSWWLRHNEPLLAEYYQSLSQAERGSDFVEFAMAEFDKAQTLEASKR